VDVRPVIESLEAISDGFALFDRAERLVLANGKFCQCLDVPPGSLAPGMLYEDVLRTAHGGDEAGFAGLSLGREAFIQEQLFRFRHPGEPVEQRLPDGRWIRIADHKTAEGGTVCVRTDISALKDREAALRDSERRYRQLVDLSPDGIAVHDTRGTVRFVNAAGRRILGQPVDAPAAGLSVLTFATEESQPLAAAMLRRVTGQGETVSQVRIRLRRPDGRELTTEISAVPFHSAGERLVLVLFRDVSGEAAASLRLRESEARARSILETALDAIVSIDADGHILEFNPAAERIFGWRRAEVIGRPMADVIIPDHHREAHQAGMDRISLTGRARVIGRRIEVEARRRDGSVFPVELSITEVPLGPGRRFTAYIRDITEQRRVQQEVAEKTRILEAMMESIGIGIQVYDADGRLLLANRKLAELLDLPPQLIQPGTHDTDLVRWLAAQGEYPDETPEESLAIYTRIRARGAWFGERRRPNGRWLQIRHFPMPGGGFVALFTDTTEQKNLESQLLQSQKMEALGQLAGGIAHDFNNILSVIGGYATLAGGNADPDSALAQNLARITQGVQRASTLTRELLTFSRRKVVQARTVDLATVVRNQEFLLKPLLGETVALTVTLPPGPVWVSVDPDMAAQALVNLCINARDAMPGGGPLWISLGPAPASPRPADLPGAGPHAMLSVRDGGTGMSEAVKARIFEPFFTTKPPGQGTGLGLAMVYGTMRQAGGAVAVETAEGAGTCFHLWFPCVDPPLHPGQTAPAETRPAPRQRPATILVAEDEPDLLALCYDVLEEEGFQVVMAGDGREALDRFQAMNGAVDLLLTDLVMPEIGGAELARTLRGRCPSLKVLFMTGYPSRGQYAAADLPADATILYKPIDLAMLKQAVAQALT